jgi:hypothetical protein
VLFQSLRVFKVYSHYFREDDSWKSPEESTVVLVPCFALKSFFSSQDPGLDVASRKYLLLKGLLLCAMSMNYDL